MSNDASIAQLGEQEEIYDAYLIDSQIYAQGIGDFWLGETAFPYTVLRFSAVANDAKIFSLELYDAVALYTDWSNIVRFVGIAVQINRNFGSLARKSVNTWDVTLVGFLMPVVQQDMGTETMTMQDGGVVHAKGWSLTPWNAGWPG